MQELYPSDCRSGRLRTALVLILAGTVAIMLSIFSQLEDWKRDLTTNHAKLDPESPDVSLRPLTVGRTPNEVADRVVRWAKEQPRWSLQSRRDSESGITLDLTRTTKMFRFTDDIHVQLEADGDETRIEAESRSRLGKGDLGQNPRNLRELVNGVREDR
jgi:uncharacterized protein (DUF1499 family)